MLSGAELRGLISATEYNQHNLQQTLLTLSGQQAAASQEAQQRQAVVPVSRALPQAPQTGDALQQRQEFGT